MIKEQSANHFSRTLIKRPTVLQNTFIYTKLMSTYLQPMVYPSFCQAQAQIYYVQKAQTIITMYLHTYSIIDIGQQDKTI